MATQDFVHPDYKTATDALKQPDAVLATVIDQVGDCTLDKTWKPYCTIATWYLWRSLERLPN